MTDLRPGLRQNSSAREPSWSERAFAEQLYALHQEGWQMEYQFAPDRKWRFDFAWPREKLAVEINGLLNNGRGSHQRPAGVQSDYEKFNRAVIEGWVVLLGTSRMVKSGDLLDTVLQALWRMK